MMASKAIKPVYDVFKEAGFNSMSRSLLPTVSGYYSDSKTGRLLSQPFNSSTPVLFTTKTPSRSRIQTRNNRQKPGADMADYAAKLKPPV